MTLSEMLKNLSDIEAVKPLIEQAKSEIGDLPDMELKDYTERLKTGEKSALGLTEMSKKQEELNARIIELEPTKAKAESYEKQLSQELLEREFTSKALAAGVQKEAISAALKLANLSGVKVDLEQNKVTGITQDVFDRLNTAQSFLFAPVVPVRQLIPALPSIGSNAEPTPKIENGNFIQHFLNAQELSMLHRN